MKNKLFFAIITFVLFSSCKVEQKIKLLQNEIATSNTQSYHSNHQLKLLPNDIIYINVITNNEEINDIFSQKASGIASQGVPSYDNGLASYRGFKIGLDGKIDFPTIGNIYVEGKSIEDLEKELKTKLNEFANEIKVIIKLANFKVTILGDVRNPKSIVVPDEKMTIFELLGLAGDVNITADLRNAVILRDYNGKIKKEIIDLTQSGLINSDYYFLKQNDVLYIPPKKNKFVFNNYIPYFGTILGSMSVILSVTTILLR
jgi:polysaccharide export outer membrane protein